MHRISWLTSMPGSATKTDHPSRKGRRSPPELFTHHLTLAHRQPAIIDPDRFDDWLDLTCRIRREIGVNCQDRRLRDRRGNWGQNDFRHRKLGDPSVDALKAIQINGLRMSALWERGLREGCKPSTILQDARPMPFYFQRVLGFPTSFPHHFPPVEFVLFSGLSFSVRPVFSVPAGPRPNLVRLG